MSLLLGLMVGLLNDVARRYADFSKLLEPIVAIFAAFVTRLFIEYVHPACFASIVLATIVWFLPGARTLPSLNTYIQIDFVGRGLGSCKIKIFFVGLSLTIGVSELATRNMISGTSRLLYAVLIALELGFGMAVGTMNCFFYQLTTCSLKLV